MLLFFTSGIFATAVMRLVVARVCTFVISSGALKPNRIVLVGLADELAANDALSALERYGYVVVRVFSLPADEDRTLDEDALKVRLREVTQLRQRHGYRRNNRSDSVELNGPSRRG